MDTETYIVKNFLKDKGVSDSEFKSLVSFANTINKSKFLCYDEFVIYKDSTYISYYAKEVAHILWLKVNVQCFPDVLKLLETI